MNPDNSADTTPAGQPAGDPGGLPLAIRRQLHDLQNLLWSLSVHAELTLTDSQCLPSSRQLMEPMHRDLQQAMQITSALRSLVRQLPTGDETTVPATCPPVARDLPVAEPRSLRVLCLEHDAAVRELLIQLLKHLGHQADPARNVDDALARLDSLAYDAVFATCENHQLDKSDLLRQIHERRVVPVIWMSPTESPECCPVATAGMEQTVPQCLLSKPISLRSLREILAVLNVR